MRRRPCLVQSEERPAALLLLQRQAAARCRMVNPPRGQDITGRSKLIVKIRQAQGRQIEVRGLGGEVLRFSLRRTHRIVRRREDEARPARRRQHNVERRHVILIRTERPRPRNAQMRKPLPIPPGFPPTASAAILIMRRAGLAQQGCSVPPFAKIMTATQEALQEFVFGIPVCAAESRC